MTGANMDSCALGPELEQHQGRWKLKFGIKFQGVENGKVWSKDRSVQ